MNFLMLLRKDIFENIAHLERRVLWAAMPLAREKLDWMASSQLRYTEGKKCISKMRLRRRVGNARVRDLGHTLSAPLSHTHALLLAYVYYIIRCFTKFKRQIILRDEKKTDSFNSITVTVKM